jgi:hypothetical protein
VESAAPGGGGADDWETGHLLEATAQAHKELDSLSITIDVSDIAADLTGLSLQYFRATTQP